MIDSARIAEAVRDLVPRAARILRPDVRDALVAARATETSERGRDVLDQLIENARIAEADGVPLCQDTGTVWVRVTIGPGQSVAGDLRSAVDGAVAAAWGEAGLRASVCRDALIDRTNSGDNTPAFLDVTFGEREGVSVAVMLKGGGSDNASVVAMLAPSDGADGVADVVLSAVRAKAAAACPPLLVGVGVGGTFDTVGKLAKAALLRPVGAPSRSAALEARLLGEVNATGIGPGGLGGDTTALAVHVESAPCHIASLPVAVNMGCCAVRTAAAELA